LAPKHVVVLPIYRNDDERTEVLSYCDSLVRELNGQSFSGGRVMAWIDDRDMRGGEKNWQHIKRGVPLRVEVGPRDIAKGGVFLSRRDDGQRGPVERAEFVKTVGQRLDSIQDDLFRRALDLRETNTHKIDSLDEFRAFFTPQNAEKPEIHGGFALCHWNEDLAVNETLKDLKVTIRCVPSDADDEPGTCIFTGKPSPRRVVFGKAY
jgi:prolyl-tRNA synthetase